MAAWIGRIKALPVVAQVLATFERFAGRLGWQFAAAITYFSVLSMVPILMIAFAGLGFAVTMFFPDMVVTIQTWIIDTFSGQGDIGDQLLAVVDQAFGSWQAVGVIGLGSAAWAGATWVASLRAAVRAQMRPSFDVSANQTSMVVQTVVDLGILFALFLLMGVTAVSSTVATTAHEAVFALLNLDEVGGGPSLLAVTPVVASLIAGFLLFLFMFRVFPERRVQTPTLVKGAVIGSVGFAGLQYLAGILIRVFSGNAAAAVFGSVIVIMLFLNLFATLILLVAAWMATHPDEAVATGPALAEGLPRQPTDYATKLLIASLNQSAPDAVPTRTAVQAARVGMGAGAIAGAALAGLAAVAASAISGWQERR